MERFFKSSILTSTLLLCLGVLLIFESEVTIVTISYIIGSILGGVFQISAYTLVKIVMFDKAYAFSSLPTLAIQTAVGIAVALVFIAMFNKTNVTAKLRKMAE